MAGREDLARRLEEGDGTQLVEIPAELCCLGNRDDHTLLPRCGNVLVVVQTLVEQRPERVFAGVSSVGIHSSLTRPD